MRPSGTRRGRRRASATLANEGQLYGLLLLPVAFFLLFRYIPMLGIVIAFQDYNIFKGVFGSPWVGLDLFKEVFRMSDFWDALRNTLVLNGLGLVVGFPAPVILALLLNEVRLSAVKRTFQSILYLPHFISWVIVGTMVLQLFATNSGLVNTAIRGLGGKPVPFLSDELGWVLTYTGVSVWQGAGWATIIYLAALTGINPELYEAAEVDGAGRWNKIWNITLPGIRATMVVLLILQVGRIMSIGFEQPYILGNYIVQDVSDVISTFVYRVGIQNGRYNVGTAVGLFQSVAGMVFLIVTNQIATRTGEEGIW